MINYNQKVFASVQNSPNGEVSAGTTFFYREENNIVTAVYKGGGIRQGHLIALKTEDGCLDMRYHHINSEGKLMTGICYSVPEILMDGRVRLHEKWQWTSGSGGEGISIVEELPEEEGKEKKEKLLFSF